MTENRSHTREQIMFYRVSGMTENLCEEKKKQGFVGNEMKKSRRKKLWSKL